ncbi:hypothetical protein [Nocardioides ultimimeridianus]
MSKVDALRAMREARYAQQTASAPAPQRAKPAGLKPVAKTAKAAPAAESASDDLCGHRNMSGRTCTRERGHSAKSHRYS